MVTSWCVVSAQRYDLSWLKYERPAKGGLPRGRGEAQDGGVGEICAEEVLRQGAPFLCNFSAASKL